MLNNRVASQKQFSNFKSREGKINTLKWSLESRNLFKSKTIIPIYKILNQFLQIVFSLP